MNRSRGPRSLTDLRGRSYTGRTLVPARISLCAQLNGKQAAPFYPNAPTCAAPATGKRPHFRAHCSSSHSLQFIAAHRSSVLRYESYFEQQFALLQFDPHRVFRFNLASVPLRVTRGKAGSKVVSPDTGQREGARPPKLIKAHAPRYATACGERAAHVIHGKSHSCCPPSPARCVARFCRAAASRACAGRRCLQTRRSLCTTRCVHCIVHRPSVFIARRGHRRAWTASACRHAIPQTSLFDQQDLADTYRATDLPGLLQLAPGAQISRTGGPGSTASLYLRGASSTQSLILDRRRARRSP